MKLSILALTTALSLSAFAAEEKPLLNCTVPSEAATKVTLTLTVTNDSSADFVKATLVDGQTTISFFSQIQKGEAASQMAAGSLGLLLVSESSRQENGVLRNGGFLGVRKQDNKMSGLLSAQSSLYPLECTAAQ